MSERKLTPQQGDVMDYLGRREYRETSVVLSDMARHMDLPPNGLSRTMASLARIGLAERVSSHPVRYRLTRQGLAVQGHREGTRRWQRMTGAAE